MGGEGEGGRRVSAAVARGGSMADESEAQCVLPLVHHEMGARLVDCGSILFAVQSFHVDLLQARRCRRKEHDAFSR